ncbi:MAG: zinc-dependent metalloprotease [Promicromonosporaceae bacterium]|nr:zinc-dependent metalloprotease [Promicromonosporaceae bacterium]
MASFDDLTEFGGDDEREQRLRELLTPMFGDRAGEVLAHMRAQGMDMSAMAEGALPTPEQFEHAMAQAKRILTDTDGGPVNTTLAHDMARQVAITEGDPSLTGTQAKEALAALAVADLWLDAATTLPPAGGARHAWCRAEWVEATLPAWHSLIAPVAASMSVAMATVLGDEADDEFGDASHITDATGMPGLQQLGLAGLSPQKLMQRLGAAAFGMQVGQAAGTLSREVFGVTDVGLPLLPEAGAALLPTNVAAFATGLDAPLEEVRHYLAVREAAHARLFAHVPWLRTHLLALVEQYARGIVIDLDTLGSHLRGVDSADPSQLQRAMSGGGLFAVQPTKAQQATLLRLETALALVEGWVDEVSAQAALPHLPYAVPLREMLRRRRAAGGPAEQTFASLVGLDLRPRRSRDAAALFAHVYVAGSEAGRDAVWDHPDLLPDAADLDTPSGYLARREAQRLADEEIDAALSALLDGDLT